MGNMITAIFLITDFVFRASQAAAEWTAVVQKARTEGRDLTFEELEDIRDRRKAAVDRLLES